MTNRPDLQLRVWDWVLRRWRPSIDGMDLDQIRRLRTMRVRHNAVTDLLFGAVASDVSVEDRSVRITDWDVPLRIYRPRIAGEHPIVVWFHGGGWVVGNVYHTEWLKSHVASRVGAVVVAVGYRLAPEHPFPTAVNDAYDAVVWIAAHADELGGSAERLAVMGASAGGNLAAVVCQRARDESGPRIAQQVLLYPATDMSSERRSARYLEDAPMLPLADRIAYLRHYTGGVADVRDPRLSPGLAGDLSGLPPALIITAEHDPLRDEAHRYAERLRAHGTPARYSDYAGMVHGFLSFPGLASGARQALAEICHTLRDGLA